MKPPRRLSVPVSSYLTKFTRDRDVVRLLECSLGRILERDLDKNIRAGLGILHGVNDEKASHIRDWLEAAIRNTEPWLQNVDDMGRPKKLMKFGSVDDIVREADAAMLRFARSAAGTAVMAGDETVVAELADGFRIVRLLTANALDRESGVMQHCIGQGGYDHKVESTDYSYFSLRDAFGKPHATFELDLRRIRGPVLVQAQGKQNRPPVDKYARMLAQYFLDFDIRATQVGDFVIGNDGMVHHLSSLPSGLRVPGDLHVESRPELVLPDDAYIMGDLTILDCRQVHLPARLKVGKSLQMRNSAVVTAAEEIVAGRLVDLSSLSTPSIGVASSITANHLTAIRLPDWTVVDGKMNLRGAVVVESGVDNELVATARHRPEHESSGPRNAM